jgi:hypothetical protein
MEIIKRFLTLIETEKDQNIKTDLIHNMYYHIFDLQLDKQIGKLSISQDIKKYEAQAINMSFWKAKLAKVSWIPSFYVSIKNTLDKLNTEINKLCQHIDTLYNPIWDGTEQMGKEACILKANYQYMYFSMIVSNPQMFLMNINREQFIKYFSENTKYITKYSGKKLYHFFKILQATNYTYKYLVHNVDILISEIKNIDSLDEKGETLLMEAVRWRQDDALLYLAHLGADPNIQNPVGKTAMHMTCGKLHKRKWSYLPVLVGLGGNLDIKTKRNKSVKEYALEHYGKSSLQYINSQVTNSLGS